MNIRGRGRGDGTNIRGRGRGDGTDIQGRGRGDGTNIRGRGGGDEGAGDGIGAGEGVRQHLMDTGWDSSLGGRKQWSRWGGTGLDSGRDGMKHGM